MLYYLLGLSNVPASIVSGVVFKSFPEIFFGRFDLNLTFSYQELL